MPAGCRTILRVHKLIVGTEALAAGLVSRRELNRRYVKVHRNVYLRRGAELTARDRAIAAWLWSGRTATVSGMSAAALLGSKWVPAEAPAELVRTRHEGAPPGIMVHKDAVADEEMGLVTGINCTNVPRTAFDLGRRLTFEKAVIRVDALLNATGVPVQEVADLAADHPGARNIRRLRRVLEIADGGAESPQETRVRMVLTAGGLPRPVTQIRVRLGAQRRRIDMGWPEYLVGVEYDGQQHWNDPIVHAGDIGRLEFLAGLGWVIVRVSAWHLRCDRPGIVDRAATALRAAGWPG